MTDTKACLSCGSNDFRSFTNGVDYYRVKQCRKCGLGMTAKARKDAVSGDIYGKDYFADKDTVGGVFFSDSWKEYDKKRFVAELRRLERLTQVGKVLDVGCATGNFLYHAAKRGWQVYGYDVSEFAVRCTKERTNACVATGSLGPRTFREEFFDVVTAHHLLEHIENPKTFLNDSVLPLLKYDGIVLIEVPNFASLEAMVLRGEWEDLRSEQHFWHFTPKSLKMFLEGVGVRLIRLYTLGNPLWYKRLLLDYPWMIVAALVHLPYGGDTGRTGEKKQTNASPVPHSYRTSNAHSMLFHISRIIGVPIMTFVNMLNMGKRLVAIGRKGRR